MSVHNPPRPSLTVSGRPMSLPLKDVRALSRQMVGHFVANVAPCGTLPGDAISGDVTTITRICLEFAVGMLDGRDVPSQLQRLQDAASAWAREGVPIDTIHHSIAEGFKMGLDLVVSSASGKDFDSLVGGVKVVMELLDTITAQISMAYVRELRGVVSEHHTAVHTLTSALLGGHSTSTMARECGITIAETYAVFALAIPQHREEANPALDSKVVARRKLRRVQAELAKRCGDSALSLLSVDGGTVLIPAETFDREGLTALVAQLSQAAQVGITAAMVETTTTGVPDAADQAHELLDMVQRLEVTSGLYRFDELALEYQLTRPGPGREFLGSLLDPLDQYPELLETLQRHIANNLNRQRTARVLHVHTNTVDYRLKRIGQLTGFDPTQPSGLWYLRSALVARSYRSVPA
ncbi:PucR family transcriptional regulator [Nocardia salmonicida]|uniref:PucR family transcriptional regulator n=1 Tax=Nocardia TaxID=1817 RepID=UPI0006FEF452|nr:MULTISPECIES: helix-turn-helix domain-containing protein [Nocardia]KQY34837.1 transcriptional regulator [Nocardia sp. Root136]WKG12319.1 helix-turn-helix domain-containing protein [Nocardia sp. PE-7]